LAIIAGAPAAAIAAMSAPLVILGFTSRGLAWSAALFVLSIAAFEVGFRLVYRRRTGHTYALIPKIPFKQMYVEPHPYLPYVYKRKAFTQRGGQYPYPLHRGGPYETPTLTSNSRRHMNGPDGDREIVVPKPAGLFRVNCLGASTTGNYLVFEGKNYSYPLALEEVLQQACPDRSIEVNNCGIGGYTSADLLIKFLLDTVDTDPDVIVVYHAYNDLAPSLTPGFESDYSHAKRNLGEVYHLYRWASKVPYVPLASYNYVTNLVLPQNVRYTLLAQVARGQPDARASFAGLGTYRRNIEHLIHVCRGRGIAVVLSTSCHFMYPAIVGNFEHQKYATGVNQENEVMRDVARRLECPLVDAARLMPMDERFFVDSVHYSPPGMVQLASLIAQPLIPLVAGGRP
jgi:lysophospholipase L1-like esterase